MRGSIQVLPTEVPGIISKVTEKTFQCLNLGRSQYFHLRCNLFLLLKSQVHEVLFPKYKTAPLCA